jgi:hypothetical protein
MIGSCERPFRRSLLCSTVVPRIYVNENNELRYTIRRERREVYPLIINLVFHLQGARCSGDNRYDWKLLLIIYLPPGRPGVPGRPP